MATNWKYVFVSFTQPNLPKILKCPIKLYQVTLILLDNSFHSLHCFCLSKNEPMSNHLFSTSVELESDNACLYQSVSVCHKNFGAAWRLQKWSDLVDIWPSCSLGEYLGIFFSFFKKFDFWGLETSFYVKTRLKFLGSLET